ncbi:MAG: PAS domain S-box protein, partial [Candidatus Aegiribacteria sp.]|nr:PAS domain S-box protein [Candidatus Aegiribacteria sp.]
MYGKRTNENRNGPDEMIETFFNSQGAGVIVADGATGAVVAVNDSALKLLGMPENALTGKLASVFIKGADGRPLSPSAEPVQAELSGYRGRKTAVIASTTECTLNETRGIIHSFIRFTPSEEDEEFETGQEDNLTERGELFRTITDSTQEAIFMMNDLGAISFVNSAGCSMFGYAKHEMMQEDLHDLLAPSQYHEAFRKGFNRFVESGEGIVVGRTIEIEGKKRDGTVFPVELSITSTRLGGRWHAVGVIRDITERRRVEKEILQAREAAENASRTKSEFLANMSHEIRTPLNSIIGTTDLLQETDIDEEQKKYLDMMQASSKSLLALINDILDISRIEAGKITLECIPFSVRKTMKRVMHTLSLRAEKKGLELVSRIEDEVPEYVEGDPNRLTQVIVNLVGNSIKFTESGEIVVHVKPLKNDAKKTVLQFSVSDTGVGIPPAKLENIFNSFTQADPSVTRRYGGTGLGLAICRNLVNLMKGEITVESQLDQGSTFTFTAEFLTSRKEQNMDEDTDEDQEDVTIPNSKNLRILLVDDSPDNRFLIKAFLRKQPCLLMEAENGRQAVQKYQLKRWDLILMDMQMPVMDGYEATRRIRKLEEEKGLQHTPIVALTAHTINTEVQKCLDSGCDVHLAKPVSKKGLIRLISTITREEEKGEKSHSE